MKIKTSYKTSSEGVLDTVTVKVECDECWGSGITYHNDDEDLCLACGAEGYIEVEKTVKTCPSCSGSGYYDSWDTKNNRPIYCGSCEGEGKVYA